MAVNGDHSDLEDLEKKLLAESRDWDELLIEELQNVTEAVDLDDLAERLVRLDKFLRVRGKILGDRTFITDYLGSQLTNQTTRAKFPCFGPRAIVVPLMQPDERIVSWDNQRVLLLCLTTDKARIAP